MTRPKSGSMLLYSRKKVRYRRDGYCWKKRKDGKTTREDHMKLKVQGTEVRVHSLFTVLTRYGWVVGPSVNDDCPRQYDQDTSIRHVRLDDWET